MNEGSASEIVLFFVFFCFFNDNEGINGWNPLSLKEKDEEPLIKKKTFAN